MQTALAFRGDVDLSGIKRLAFDNPLFFSQSMNTHTHTHTHFNISIIFTSLVTDHFPQRAKSGLFGNDGRLKDSSYWSNLLRVSFVQSDIDAHECFQAFSFVLISILSLTCQGCTCELLPQDPNACLQIRNNKQKEKDNLDLSHILLLAIYHPHRGVLIHPKKKKSQLLPDILPVNSERNSPVLKVSH